MTNELGTTLHDIEAKAERKNVALTNLAQLYFSSKMRTQDAYYLFETIRKYIEEN